MTVVSGTKALLTVDDYFRTPDGRQCKYVWGRVNIVLAQDLLGIKPHNSANWYAVVGEGEGSVVLAGCRIHYAVACERPPAHGEIYSPPSESNS